LLRELHSVIRIGFLCFVPLRNFKSWVEGLWQGASVDINRCCARGCYSQFGQAFCFVGCATPNVTFSTFVNCSTYDDGDADYGALSDDAETSAAISPNLLDVGSALARESQDKTIRSILREVQTGAWCF
jgi:hypothetical protein